MDELQFPERFIDGMQKFDGEIGPRSAHICDKCGYHISYHRPVDSACPLPNALRSNARD